MNKMLLTMTALGALAAATPAAAQFADAGANAASRIQSRISQLGTRIDAGIQAGTITRTEARPLKRQLMRLTRLERQFSRDGLTDVEKNDLQTRLRDLRYDIRVAAGDPARNDRFGSWDDDDRNSDRIDRNNDGWDDRDTDRDGRWDDNVSDGRYADRIDRNNDGWDDRDTDRDGRWDDNVSDGRYADRIDRNNDGWDDRDTDRDGRWDDNVNDGRYADRIDRNNDGWDDRDTDRDGRWDDDVAGQGGPYEDTNCQTRGGLGGVLDTVLGREGCAGLRVGQRVSGDLGAVPYQYRAQFRDGSGFYHRSDGRFIYRIDARTHTVLKVYSMTN